MATPDPRVSRYLTLLERGDALHKLTAGARRSARMTT
jgi:hypothetical protein